MAHGAILLTISALIDTSARHYPDGLALLAPGRSPLSYRRLKDLCVGAAQQLHTLGISRDDRVALVLPNGPEMATAFLAATCAPLNPAYSAREFDFYLADLHASAVLVQRDVESPVREVARARGITVIELLPSGEAEAGIFCLEAPAKQSVNAEPERPDDVALPLHTSGTTSRPKLVPLSHANLCESAASIARTLGLSPADRCLNVMPLFHIHGLVAALWRASALAEAWSAPRDSTRHPSSLGWKVSTRPGTRPSRRCTKPSWLPPKSAKARQRDTVCDSYGPHHRRCRLR